MESVFFTELVGRFVLLYNYSPYKFVHLSKFVCEIRDLYCNASIYTFVGIAIDIDEHLLYNKCIKIRPQISCKIDPP